MSWDWLVAFKLSLFWRSRTCSRYLLWVLCSGDCSRDLEPSPDVSQEFYKSWVLCSPELQHCFRAVKTTHVPFTAEMAIPLGGSRLLLSRFAYSSKWLILFTYKCSFAPITREWDFLRLTFLYHTLTDLLSKEYMSESWNLETYQLDLQSQRSLYLTHFSISFNWIF